ncbi:polyketide synthase [Colletotrichum incanum]|uniref:Polyketide synthase n=1 Tax=Colletotrichum incanum TaxID=1573173 RepID=A0A161W2B6_COLIC|nr:polyketide synthase [Colletotrichum incanum]OHW95277.1 polyketide synthase [Colletotrichum incanum]
MIRTTGLEGYLEHVHPVHVQLCTSLILDALQKLRCDVRGSQPGQKLRQVAVKTSRSIITKGATAVAARNHLSLCWTMLVNGGLVTCEADGSYTRTAMPAPEKSAAELLANTCQLYPGFQPLTELIFHLGKQLAELWVGRTDSVKITFGSAYGRRLLDNVYGPSHPCKTFHALMEDFMSRLLNSDHLTSQSLDYSCGPAAFNILELGSGTGGTTKWLAPLLERQHRMHGTRFTYTFTDLGSSFVAQAARTFAQYADFMTFMTLDIDESMPPPSLVGSQHVVIAVNVVHATVNITKSLRNLRRFLRPDGFALIMEIEEPLCCTEFVFGIFEGWWRFGDGRARATTNIPVWQEAFREAGFGHIDWTRGALPDSKVQRVYLAMNDRTV